VRDCRGAEELFRPTGAGGHGSGGIASGPGAVGGGPARCSRPAGREADRLRGRARPGRGGVRRVRGRRKYEAAGLRPAPGYEEGAVPQEAAASARPGLRNGGPGLGAPPHAGPAAGSGTRRRSRVYVSPEELLGLEQARIALRAEHGLAVDRGRIVREAIDLILADPRGQRATSSLLVRLAARRLSRGAPAPEAARPGVIQ